ncbi:TonB-dependent receptor [bacterium]|nr:TonB-dependent receptor [bacterium]
MSTPRARFAGGSLALAAASFAALTAVFSPSAGAQTPPGSTPAPEPGDTSQKSFTSGYFVPFNPVTAEDMVRRIPGFTLDDGGDRRGFTGATGNVLIDGEVPSSKTRVSEQLARISARDVLRIDLFSGASQTSDLRGQSTFVDVRLRPRSAGATNTFVAQANRLEPSGSINPVLTITRAFNLRGAAVSGTLQAQPNRRGRIEFDRTLLDPSGNVLERSDEHLQGTFREYSASGRVTFSPGARDAVSLNAEGSFRPVDGRHTFSETRTPSGDLLRVEDSLVEGLDPWSVELGGDWEHRFSSSSSVKLVGLMSRDETASSERYSVFPASGAARDTLIARSATADEYVARGVWTIRATPSVSIDAGVEGALNTLDNALDIKVATLGQIIDRTPPVADTRVEEKRVETFVTTVWSASENLRLEAGLNLETSTIRQSGDASQERDFSYLKPSLNASWRTDSGTQYRLKLERDIAQLDFSEFASAVSLFDGTVDVGNPDLEPEKTWRTQLEWERRLGPKGALVLTLFHDAVEDVQDQIPLSGQLEGPGNLGDGRRAGLRLDATIPVPWLGGAASELRVKALVQDTRVDDPTSGETRRFANEPDWTYSIDFRRPAPSWKMLFGATFDHKDEVDVFRLRELRTNGFETGKLDLFAETTAVNRLVIRVTLSNVFRPTEVRTRELFAPSRADAANLTGVERRLATGGFGTRSIGVRVSGRF